MEQYFKYFRENTIGNEQLFETPYGTKKMIYADWIASGRLYRPIEEKMINVFGPFVANTHTETSETGTLMTNAYHLAHEKIKKHVNADKNDIIITSGFGMTGVINKLQRILGLKTCGLLDGSKCQNERERPVVFITHMEHHSNQTSWIETLAKVVVIPPGEGLKVDINILKEKLEEYKDSPLKIGSFTACSNVSGVFPDYYELAKVMHEFGGICFIDFAASAPYVDIDMHPSDDPMKKLDGIFFSPHKFLGGPGSSGVLIFDKALYKNTIPDQPGGGTVDWTNPWGEYKFIDDIEIREDGGTPGFLQAIRTALCIELKNQMGVKNIEKREKELVAKAFEGFRKIKKVHILADNIDDRLGAFSFYIENIHFNLVVKLMNDLYGIQVRGGCACAGTYGHYLLDVSYEQSKTITDMINTGDLSTKPGWIRLSLHPTMTNEELEIVINAVSEIVENIDELKKSYIYNKHTNEFRHNSEPICKKDRVKPWFNLS